MRVKGLYRGILVAVVAIFCCTPAVQATNSNSTSYQITETQIGGGSTVNTCSGQYCAKVSIGNSSAAQVSSGGNASFSSNEGSEPRLEMIVGSSTTNLGVIDAETTATKTATVQINNYLVGGYQLVISGDPPKIPQHTLAAPSSPTASVPGTEQFAINVVANSSPNIGTNPVQVPSGAGTFGSAAAGYNTTNQFKYVAGNTIAESTAQSGRTDFTISFIINISNSTPAGKYSGTYTVMAVPAY